MTISFNHVNDTITILNATTGANTANNLGRIGTLNVSSNIAVTGNIIVSGINLLTAINASSQLIPQNPQAADYILQISDAGKHIYYTQATSSTLYIPTTANVAFANGSTVMIISKTSASANVTVTPNNGVSLFLAGSSTSASRNVTTYGMASLIHVEANTWFINGTGVV